MTSTSADHGRAGTLVIPLALPLQSAPATVMHPGPTGSHTDAGARPLRALIVEDEFIIALELEMLLSGFGIEVVGQASTGERALMMAEETRPDFATMDIKLAGPRDGIDTATEIFTRFGIRAVFVSAYKDPELVERAAAARPIGWVRKPVSEGALRNALRNLSPGLH